MLSKSNMDKTREKNMLVYSFEILEGEKVFINNGVVSYMFDSFKCLRTFDKLRIRKNKGLFYRGSTYIEKENITKLKKISSFLSPIHVEQIVKKPMLLSFQPRVNIGGSFF